MKTKEETQQDLETGLKSGPVDEKSRNPIEVLIVILLCPLYWTLGAIAMVTFFLPVLLYRFIIIKTCSYFHPTWSPLSMRDNFLGEDDVTTKPKTVMFVLEILNDPLPLDEYRKKYNDTIVQLRDPQTGEYLFSKYMQYYERWMGYNFWKWDQDFKIENHIRLMEGTETNEFTTEQQLVELLGPALNAGFQPKRSYWEVLIVENFRPKDSETPNVRKNAYLFRIHHGLGDGYSLLKTYVKYMCHEGNLDKIVVPKFNVAKGSLLIKWWNSFYTIASMPHVLIRQNLIDVDSNVWFKREEELTGKLLAGRSKALPVEVMKAIRRKYGVSFNVVFYAMLAGGLRKYFLRNKMEVPKVIRTFVPFPWKNHPNDKFVNHWTCAVVPAITGIDCPIERLHKAQSEFNKVKLSAAPLVNYCSMAICGWTPSWFIRTAGKNTFSTATVSIFPGPTQEMKFFGETAVDDQSFWAPQGRGRVGIGFGIGTYKGSVRVTIKADTAIMRGQEYVEELLKDIEDEVNVLLVNSGKSS